MKNLYCHIKANLRDEKRLLKCASLERDLRSNLGSADTTGHASRLAKGAQHGRELWASAGGNVLEPVVLLGGPVQVAHPLCPRGCQSLPRVRQATPRPSCPHRPLPGPPSPRAAPHPVSVQSVLRWLPCQGLCPTLYWLLGKDRDPPRWIPEETARSQRQKCLPELQERCLFTRVSQFWRPDSWASHAGALLGCAQLSPWGSGVGARRERWSAGSQRGSGATLQGPWSREGPAGTVLQEVRDLDLHTHKGPGLDARGPGLRS